NRVMVPVVVTVGTLTLQGTLYVLFAPRYGLSGVSWATVIATSLQLVVLILIVSRNEQFGLRQWFSGAVRVWVSAALSGLAVWAVLQVVPEPFGWLQQLALL